VVAAATVVVATAAAAAVAVAVSTRLSQRYDYGRGVCMLQP
jgi:hypothetical protein